MMSNYVCVCSRRRSVLTIARVSKSDAGKYECKAVSVTDEKVCASAHVTVTNEQPPSRLDNSEYICIFKFHLRPFQSAAFWFCALWVTHDAFALSRHRARAAAGLWPRARRKSGVAGAENVGRDQVWEMLTAAGANHGPSMWRDCMPSIILYLTHSQINPLIINGRGLF